MMVKLRPLLHDYKLYLSVLLVLGSLSLLALAIIGYPNSIGQDGRGPLAPLRGINILLILLSIIGAIVGFYYLYRYIRGKSRFEELMSTDSQAIFKKNQIEIERLALQLTTREERRVLKAIKRYRIK